MDWWVVVAELPYFGLAKREVEWFSRTFHRWFGVPLRSVRFYVATVLLSVIVTTATAGTAMYWLADASTWTLADFQILGLLQWWRFTILSALRLDDLQTGMYVGNIVGDVLGMGVALGLLESMTGATRPRQLFGFVALDLVVAVMFTVLVLILTGFADRFTAGEPVIAAVSFGLHDGPLLLIQAAAGDREAIAICIPAVVAVVPSMFHVALIIGVLTTKLATPLLRPPLLLVLERASEAEKGGIMLVAGAVAATIKLMQLAIAAFSAQ